MPTGPTRCSEPRRDGTNAKPTTYSKTYGVQ